MNALNPIPRPLNLLVPQPDDLEVTYRRASRLFWRAPTQERAERAARAYRNWLQSRRGSRLCAEEMVAGLVHEMTRVLAVRGRRAS